MANEKLVRDVLSLIENNLDAWDQESFADSGVCGTTACFGGHALLLSGYTLNKVHNFITPDGEELVWTSDIEDEARQALGLSYTEASEIFYWMPSGVFWDREVTRREEFEAFETHVLATLGLPAGVKP